MKNFLFRFAWLSTLLMAGHAQAFFYTVTGTADSTDSTTHGGSGWSSYPGPFATNGGKIFVTNSVPSTNRFFRLSF